MKDNIEEMGEGGWPRGPQGPGHVEGRHKRHDFPQGGHGWQGGPNWRGRWHGRGPGGHGGPGGGHGGHGEHNPFGFESNDFWRGPRERLERGLLRYIILDALSDGPKHGYEIIKQLEERTQGRYAPSPGTLYPTLQYLDELGLVSSDQEESRRVYKLTDAGRAELEEHKQSITGFWSRFQERSQHGAGRYEMKFIEHALGDLVRTVRMGLRSGAFNDAETMHLVRQALERFQNEVREIITRSSASTSDRPSPGEGEEKSGPDISSGEGQGTVRF